MQLELPFPSTADVASAPDPSEESPDLAAADFVVVAFSGGKDSTACVLNLLDLGVPKTKIELWHHEIDGRESSGLMDWPVTPAFCRAFAKAFALPIYFSWKQGGFEREMLRDRAPTAPVLFETPEGRTLSAGGQSAKLGTRRLFPQTGPLTTRFCSGYMKIDVASASLRNQDRFLNKRIVFVTGERAEESPSRARYAMLEPHRADCRNGSRRNRLVDHWRPIHRWTEAHVWALLRRHNVRPHPAYFAGISRCSCAFCIFSSPDQLAAAAAALPDRAGRIAAYEAEFGKTIHRTKDFPSRIAQGHRPDAAATAALALCASTNYPLPIIVPDNAWRLPAGAYKGQPGPS